MASQVSKWFFTATAVLGGLYVLWRFVLKRSDSGSKNNGRAGRQVSRGEVRNARLAYFARKELEVDDSTDGNVDDLMTPSHGDDEGTAERSVEQEHALQRSETGSVVPLVDQAGSSSSITTALSNSTTITSPDRARLAKRRQSQLAIEVRGRSHHFHSRFLCGSKPVSDPAYDEESGGPVTNPIRSVDEALSWRPCFDEFSVSWAPLRQRKRASGNGEDTSRLIVCHDMMGGYLEDRLVQGAGIHTRDVPFFLKHWHVVDAFIYFSHEFVTLPPATWTNCAHQQGVPVFATLITEHDEGAAKCKEFLASIELAHSFADQLVAMTEYYRFDGWLVNIENPLDENAVPVLVEFLKRLTHGVHQVVGAHGRVIWYDSVTREGELKWQNSLNSENQMFFNACDGIFLNYNWSADTLATSIKSAGTNARERVYVGIDAFGRGCPGGGGYNCKEALETISSHGLSAALFAPGWVYETQSREEFYENNERFWRLLEPLSVTYCPALLPVVTSFSCGAGKKLFVNGKAVKAEKWSHLSMQDLQPVFPPDSMSLLGNREALCLTHGPVWDYTCAFNGERSLSFEGTARRGYFGCGARTMTRLLSTSIEMKSSPLLVSYRYLMSPPDVIELALAVVVELADGELMHIVLPSLQKTEGWPPDFDTLDERLVERYGLCRSPTLDSSPWLQMTSTSAPSCTVLSQLRGVEHEKLESLTLGLLNVDSADPSWSEAHGWSSRYFHIAGPQFRSYTVKEIQLLCCIPNEEPLTWPVDSDAVQFKVNLGEIRVAETHWVKSTQCETAFALRCGGANWQYATPSSSPMVESRSEPSSPRSGSSRVWLDLTLLWDHPRPRDIAWFNVYAYGLNAHRHAATSSDETTKEAAVKSPQWKLSAVQEPNSGAEFIGRAYGLSYHLSQLPLMNKASLSPAAATPQCLWFAVQAVSLAGFKVSLERSPKVCFTWS